MTSVEEFLQDLGLSATEATIYLASFSVSAVTAQELAKHTGIKRTTVYNALITLTEKGFASKVQSGGKRTVFTVIEPEQIERKIQEQIEVLDTRREQFEHILPRLKREHPATEKRSAVVKQYDGVNGIKTVIDEALYCTTRKWDIIAPSNNFLTELDTTYADYFIRVRKTRGIVARSLWEYDKGRRVLNQAEIMLRNPRILPEVMHGKFPAMIVLFDNKVAIITSYREKSALLIESRDLSRTFRVLFDGLWAVSEPYVAHIQKTSHQR